jgi:hypothetical protein
MAVTAQPKCRPLSKSKLRPPGDDLKSLGRKGETYDPALKRLQWTSEYVGFADEQYSSLNHEEG